MATYLITGPFPETWQGIEHEHLVLVDGHGLDGKPWLEGPNVEIAPVADILMEDIDKDGPIIDGLCDVLLLELADSLNRIHGLDESLKYWRMILAPWIRETVHVVYLRYKTLRGVMRRYPKAELRCAQEVDAPQPPRDHFTAAELYHSPGFRHWLTHLMGSQMSAWATVFLNQESVPLPRKDSHGVPPKHRPSTLGARPRRLLVVGSNWSTFQRLQLHLGAWMLPSRSTKVTTRSDAMASSRMRSQLCGSENAYRQSSRQPLIDAIRQLLPTSVMEDWQVLCDDVQYMSAGVAALMTNSGLQRDIRLRVAAAELQKAGRPVVVVQEGGGYGTKRIPFLEDLDGELPDLFLKWGRASHPAGCSIGVASHRRVGSNWSSDGRITLLLGPSTSTPKDFGNIGRLPTSTYASDLLAFVAALSPEARTLVTARTKSSFDPIQRKDRVSQLGLGLAATRIALEVGTTSIRDAMRQSRMAVVTYHESLAPVLISRNIPTILMWSRRHSVESQVAAHVLDQLSLVGMYFSDPNSAAAHVNRVMGNVHAWWSSEATRLARAAYCDAFAQPSHLSGLASGTAIRRSCRSPKSAAITLGDVR